MVSIDLVNYTKCVVYKKGKMGEAIMSDQSTVLVSPSSKKELLKYFF